MVYSVVEIFSYPGYVNLGGGGPDNCARDFGESLGIPICVQNACYTRMSARCEF